MQKADSFEKTLMLGKIDVLLQGIFPDHISCIAGGFFTTQPLGKPLEIRMLGFKYMLLHFLLYNLE